MNQDTVIVSSVLSSVLMIQILSYLEVGIITSKFGILESHLQLDLLSDLTFVVILLISMMVIFLLDNILIPSNFNFGILEHVNQLKILAGMKVFNQRNHV